MHAPLRCGSLLTGRHQAIGEQKGLVLLDKAGQKIIFKTFKKGEAMPTHQHAAGDVLVSVLAGQLTITQEATSVEVEAGDYVIFPAGAPHSLMCREDARVLIYR